MVRIFGDIILPVSKDSLVSADMMCSIAFGVCSTPAYMDLPSKGYAEKILSGKPVNI